MNCIWAEYNEHLDDIITVASMVGCWGQPFFIVWRASRRCPYGWSAGLGESFRNAAYVHNSSLEKWDGLLQGALRTHIQRFMNQRT